MIVWQNFIIAWQNFIIVWQNFIFADFSNWQNGIGQIIVYEVKRRFSASATDGVVKQQLYENHSKYSSASE